MANEISELDKNKVIAVLSEHYLLHPQEKQEMEFVEFTNHKCSTPKNIISYGSWQFCYHRDMGVLYIRKIDA